MKRIIPAALQTSLARTIGRKPQQQTVLNSWTRAFLNKMDNLKFLAFVGEDGYPTIIPTIQLQCLDDQHLLFSTSVYRQELDHFPTGASLAVFGMSLSMEDVLLRGTYRGVRRIGGVRAGVIQVEWVYNSMPPVPGQIYPPLELNPVTDY